MNLHVMVYNSKHEQSKSERSSFVEVNVSSCHLVVDLNFTSEIQYVLTLSSTRVSYGNP